MLNKRLKAGLIAVFASTLMACGSATPAFAQANPDAEQSAVTVEEASDSTSSDTNSDSSTESETGVTVQSDGTDSTDGTDSIRDVSGALTPDGSLNLVDDVEDEDAENMQFMTVTTKDGSYYYIIIDRSGSEDNVYFLNAVDAADLMNVMTDEEREELAEKASSETEDSSTDILTPTLAGDDSQEDGEAPETEDKEEIDASMQNKVTSAIPMLGVFASIGAIIAGAYYLLKIKPEKEQAKDLDEDREFYDDDEYVNEDEWLDEDDEDGSEEPKLEYLDADDFPDADDYLDEKEEEE
jgi:hypothetical protein